MRTRPPEHVDVLIVGAGLSGVGAGCHLQRRCPDRTYAILEARDRIGGTWDLFRYPGVRSDSDMHTLGYSFAPWKEAKVIADGDSIRSYVRETAREYGVQDKVRFNHRVVGANWSSTRKRWEVTAERTDTGETVELSAGFLLGCSGYYRYDEGYIPEFAGRERFTGPIVHPQHWPEDLDYAGKRVVVIGSGATAVTLVPSMATTAAHVTMLQRSPSYVLSLPQTDSIANWLRRVLPPMAAYQATRWKNVALMTLTYQLSRRRPELAKRLIRRGLQRQLPEDFDIDTHFRPDYNPWDQRLCIVPDGDLFEALSRGDASIVTDQVDTFTEHGIRLRSGAELEADVIITATGLQLLVLGGIQLAVDGKRVDIPSCHMYKGTMLSGVPNAAMSIGYTNASWTLKCDLTCEYVCRLLNHMSAHDYGQAVAVIEDPEMVSEPLLNLDSGYVLRAVDQLPRQGAKPPWRLHQNYARDVMALRRGELDDGVLRFSGDQPVRDEALDAAPLPAAAAG
jgi:monooxygenase